MQFEYDSSPPPRSLLQPPEDEKEVAIASAALITLLSEGHAKSCGYADNVVGRVLEDVTFLDSKEKRIQVGEVEGRRTAKKVADVKGLGVDDDDDKASM